ncbi:Nitroreductase [Variovorax sp. HW608]|uniref:nitroreductase n=1 Tax=Variovorax sp. HW608 TaxID=1034889 RepID=UPI00081F79A7|nr:nitroreductase [Variovorax sp. HW608]SCK30320.1 Nitroreductase [Variovorax sp. HW608]
MPTPHPSAVLADLSSERFSCRGFRPDPVARSVQEQLLGMAQMTASWCNSQPWRVHVIEGQAIERFREVMAPPRRDDEAGPDFSWPAEYRGIYRERRLACALALYDAVGAARGDREASARQAQENFRFFGAPHVAMITTEAALGVYGAVDCGGFVANFLLAATSLGVATIPQAALASRPDRVREFLGLPQDRLVVCGISFGYADPSHPANGFRTTRAAIAEVADWMTA